MKTQCTAGPFVSYAQHAEDVMLYRALRHIDKGFYIDVGAHDPEHFSVTKAFYDRGWRGINIEPEVECHKRLLEQRQRDLNLRMIASDRVGDSEFYEVLQTGLSTENAKLAELHESSGFSIFKTNLEQKTLDAVCEEHACGEIHFLKIDVEGSEEKVLRGFSLIRHRPWIIVAEATEPLSQERCDSGIAEYLALRNYQHVFFDGLNSFYIADEHSDLSTHFDRPANPLDGYVLPSFLAAERLRSHERLTSWRLVILEEKVRALMRSLINRPQ